MVSAGHWPTSKFGNPHHQSMAAAVIILCFLHLHSYLTVNSWSSRLIPSYAVV